MSGMFLNPFDWFQQLLIVLLFQTSNPENSDAQAGDLPVAVKPDDAPEELGSHHQRLLRRADSRRVR